MLSFNAAVILRKLSSQGEGLPTKYLRFAEDSSDKTQPGLVIR